MLATLIDSGAATDNFATARGVVSTLATVRVLDNVISLQSLKNRLLGTQVLEIAPSAVLTPAARDYIRECKVEVVRGQRQTEFNVTTADTGGENANKRPQRLFVAGSVAWMPSVAKQLCSKQAKVCETSPDDSSALRSVANGLRAGHQAGVLVVQSPHATCWQAARDDFMRPAVVSNWTELNDILKEVPVNLLIMSAKTWNVPSSCNTARRFFQHLQNRS